MKPLPTDPHEFQARAMSAMIEDLFDMGSGRSNHFARLDAMRAVSLIGKEDEDDE